MFERCTPTITGGDLRSRATRLEALRPQHAYPEERPLGTVQLAGEREMEVLWLTWPTGGSGCLALRLELYSGRPLEVRVRSRSLDDLGRAVAAALDLAIGELERERAR